MKHLQVEYFALFRERVGQAGEQVSSDAANPQELFTELQTRHAGLESLLNMKVAVNDELADWATPLSDGDRVLFFPPVAGG